MLKINIIIIFFLILIISYKKRKNIEFNIINDPDIIISPSGNLGFYLLGICHYIKNNYDYKNKKIVGFSAGSLNSIFMNIDKKYDDYFLNHIFKLNLNGITKPIDIMKEINKIAKTIDICSNMNKNNNSYISISTINSLNCYNEFLTTKELIRCYNSSCFIPFITYDHLLNFYNGKLSFDSGLYYRKYLSYIKTNPLIINTEMFGRFKRNNFSILLTGLKKINNTIEELYNFGYLDAVRNKKILDNYLL